eukprot:g21181.t1
MLNLQEYNLWVCPHCERGVKVADVTDLSCEAQTSDDGIEWPWVKKAMKNFLTNLRLPPGQRALEHEVERLLALASAPLKGDCYLGIIALGFFAYHFMDTSERQNFIRTTVFGGVTFQKTVYASGWPIFGLLAIAAETVQNDLQLQSLLQGIDLGPRNCDFPGGPASKARTGWLSGKLKSSFSLEGRSTIHDGTGKEPPWFGLAEWQTSYRKCSWGRAAAYFAAAETLLSGNSVVSLAVWNSTKALVALGEHNLDGCEPNMTVYHEMQSVWPFWQILGRLEKRGLYDQAWLVP